jgi:hypothetical protein
MVETPATAACTTEHGVLNVIVYRDIMHVSQVRWKHGKNTCGGSLHFQGHETP